MIALINFVFDKPIDFGLLTRSDLSSNDPGRIESEGIVNFLQISFPSANLDIFLSEEILNIPEKLFSINLWAYKAKFFPLTGVMNTSSNKTILVLF